MYGFLIDTLVTPCLWIEGLVCLGILAIQIVVLLFRISLDIAIFLQTLWLHGESLFLSEQVQ